jgi:hypothetical protein
MLQHEIESSVENNRSFLEMLGGVLRRLEARIQSRTTVPKSAASVGNSGSRRRPDPALAMEWLRLNSNEYGGEWVAFDGGRLIAHGPDAMEVYAAAEMAGAYFPMATYIDPTHAHPFVF